MGQLRALRVALCDEHLMCLEGLAGALTEDNSHVVAMTTDRGQLAAIAESHRPDVCIMDASQPDAACLTVLEEITARTATKVVLLVDEGTAVAFVRAAVAAGVRGFVRRDATLPVLRYTVERVAAGEPLVGAESLLRTRPVASAPPPQHGRLTTREHEVLDRLIAGEDTRQIALALQISRSTTRSHIQNVRHKLGARTRLQAVVLAVGNPNAGSARPPARSVAT